MNETIKSPALKEFLDLKSWAFRNNLYVHPAYLRAVERRETVLVLGGVFAGAILTILLTDLLSFLLR